MSEDGFGDGIPLTHRDADGSARPGRASTAARQQAREDAASLREAYNRLLARAPEHRIEPRLDAVQRVCDILGDPQKAFPVIHVAGTNGKTSTARMIERLLREHDLRTGLFTSPHLSSVTERIAVDGAPVPDAVFAARWHELEPYLYVVDGELEREGQPPITYFEALALLAFTTFADAPVDVAVIEVGMGGSWDATNVVSAQVAVVTPIGLDHQQYLGPDIASIAGEKAGILTEGAFVVLGRQSEEAEEVLVRRAGELGLTFAQEGRHFGVRARDIAVGGQLISIQGLAARYDDLVLPLHGAHQGDNLATAIAATEAFLGGGATSLDADVLTTAVADMTSPGRLELVRTSPTVLVDAAHNPSGAAVLAEALTETFGHGALIGLVGLMADKDVEGVLAALEPVLSDVVVTAVEGERSLPAEDLAQIAIEVFGEERVHTQSSVEHALTRAVDLAEAAGEIGDVLGGTVVATGSVVLVGQVRDLLARRTPGSGPR